MTTLNIFKGYDNTLNYNYFDSLVHKTIYDPIDKSEIRKNMIKFDPLKKYNNNYPQINSFKKKSLSNSLDITNRAKNNYNSNENTLKLSKLDCLPSIPSYKLPNLEKEKTCFIERSNSLHNNNNNMYSSMIMSNSILRNEKKFENLINKANESLSIMTGIKLDFLMTHNNFDKYIKFLHLDPEDLKKNLKKKKSPKKIIEKDNVSNSNQSDRTDISSKQKISPFKTNESLTRTKTGKFVARGSVLSLLQNDGIILKNAGEIVSKFLKKLKKIDQFNNKNYKETSKDLYNIITNNTFDKKESIININIAKKESIDLNLKTKRISLSKNNSDNNMLNEANTTFLIKNLFISEKKELISGLNEAYLMNLLINEQHIKQNGNNKPKKSVDGLTIFNDLVKKMKDFLIKKEIETINKMKIIIEKLMFKIRKLENLNNKNPHKTYLDLSKLINNNIFLISSIFNEGGREIHPGLNESHLMKFLIIDPPKFNHGNKVYKQKINFEGIKYYEYLIDKIKEFCFQKKLNEIQNEEKCIVDKQNAYKKIENEFLYSLDEEKRVEFKNFIKNIASFRTTIGIRLPYNFVISKSISEFEKKYGKLNEVNPRKKLLGENLDVMLENLFEKFN